MANKNTVSAVTLAWPGSRACSSFAVPALGFLAMLLIAVLVGWAPLQFSIVSVFLFAAPHNWIEARFFITRLPCRWRAAPQYFTLAICGTLGFGITFASLRWLTSRFEWSEATVMTVWALWSSVMIGWVVGLAWLRSRQKPRRDWNWIFPLAFPLAALAWFAPAWWGLFLVYGHPVMAFGILDRELRRRAPEWRRLLHQGLACLPMMLAILCWRLADTPALADGNPLTLSIALHAGAGVLPALSSQLLVALHAYLEVMHYAVWLLLIPTLASRISIFSLEDVPLARRFPLARRGMALGLTVGICAVGFFWFGFATDYLATRDLYFSLAIFHVLAEIPFLLRAL